MQRAIYNILFSVALPWICLRLLWRSRRSPAWRRGIGERFGRIRVPEDFDETRATIWIHAVSVGETMAAVPLASALLAEAPDLQIVLTTMTPTGAEQARRQLGGRVVHHYAPYDSRAIIARFLRAFRPQMLILMETELWPNTIDLARRQGLGVVLANGRLSEKSWRGYARLRGLTKAMLRQIDVVCAQSEADAERFRELGADAVRVTGSLKFALHGSNGRVEPLALIARWKRNRQLIVAASTREGEEPLLLQAYRECLAGHPQALLLIVPRHPERFDRVCRLCAGEGFATGRRSLPESFAKAQVAIGDSMGEMMRYLASADVAFVGGSLVDTGCQNVLEPAALGLPITVGASRFNFAAACDLLESAGALRSAANPGELGEIWRELLARPGLRERMGESGKAVIADNQHALERTLAEIRRLP